jgi:TetR/AcrR family transcriptional regulator, mexJK operon transcriptional repressor
MGRPPKVQREQVLTAAREAFAERGFEATTLAGIAAKLHLSPAALLRHASTKEELFAACMVPGPGEVVIPVEFLRELSGDEDPREVLARIARTLVPFVERKLDEQVAAFMRSKSPEALFPMAHWPRPTPPQRGFSYLVEYFRRAVARGRLRVSDPEAAALAFFGSLHSFVTLQRVLQVPEPSIPLERYLDSLLELWESGGIPRG